MAQIASQPSTVRPLSLDSSLVRNETEIETATGIWQSVRFVQEGLLTVREALFLVDFFYKHLEPFTPILSQSFQPLTSHKALVEQEPALAITILMLASRYAELPGTAGPLRAGMIHDRLWTELQNVISRIFWARDDVQDSSAAATSHTLRCWGTCEAILLVIEWHPRALHFPPGGTDHVLVRPDSGSTHFAPSHDFSSWHEWCWRSTRLCWSLMGLAMTLANDLILKAGPAQYRRKCRLQTVISIYSVQMSERMGACKRYHS